MRLRRMCETKGSGKCHVDEQTKKDYKEGGERRQWLELALLESLKKHGTGRPSYVKVKACWFTNQTHVFIIPGCYIGICHLWDHQMLCVSIHFLYCPCQNEFLTRVVRVRERMSSKEEEVTGKWLTEDKLKKDYAPYFGCPCLLTNTDIHTV